MKYRDFLREEFKKRPKDIPPREYMKQVGKRWKESGYSTSPSTLQQKLSECEKKLKKARRIKPVEEEDAFEREFGQPSSSSSRSSIDHTIIKPFVDAIERKYPEIELDYKDLKKERHWSWYLIPLIKTKGMTPRAGTEAFYFDNDNGIEAYLTYKPVMKYYREFLNVLHHVVVDGLRDRRPMTAPESIKYYLQPVDYDKFVQHMTEFYPIADRLGLDDITKLYRILSGIDQPNMEKFPKPRYTPPVRKKLTPPPFLLNLKK